EIPAPNILLFEGWFVGTQPIDNAIFSNTKALPSPIISPTDRQFAADNNRRLHDYRTLWDRLDSLMVLYPEDYRLSQRWRLQAEQAMKAQGKSGLADEEIEAFVTYFWKALHPQLFITPLTQSEKTELVVTIRADHSLGELSTPAIGNYNSDVFNDLA
ncbi:MAG: glycerate kinase, partial [Cyanobacteria bacterium P01_F01_bin.53]